MRAGSIGLAILVVALAGCGGETAPKKSAATIAVEEKAGDFIDYYEEVLALARRHASFPDSFRVALEELPGSRLTTEEWADWTEPYRQDPRKLADELERVITELSTR